MHPIGSASVIGLTFDQIGYASREIAQHPEHPLWDRASNAGPGILIPTFEMLKLVYYLL